MHLPLLPRCLDARHRAPETARDRRFFPLPVSRKTALNYTECVLVVIAAITNSPKLSDNVQFIILRF